MTKRTTTDAKWTISFLAIQPTSKILEVGFGGGFAAELASQKVTDGFFAGIDHSKTMVQIASKRNANAIKAGRMELKQGGAEDVAYLDESFDIIYSLHSIYFWDNPVECLKGFRRVLSPGGSLAVTIQPKNRWRDDQVSTPGMDFFFGDQIIEMFNMAGWKHFQTKKAPGFTAYLETSELKLEIYAMMSYIIKVLFSTRPRE